MEALVSIVFRYRLGIGAHIEYNEDVCHISADDEGYFIAAFNGIIIHLPFLAIYIGDFWDLEEMEIG